MSPAFQDKDNVRYVADVNLQKGNHQRAGGPSEAQAHPAAADVQVCQCADI